MKRYATLSGALAALLLAGCGNYFSRAFTEYSTAIEETPRSWSIPTDSAGVVRMRIRAFLLRDDHRIDVDEPDRIEASSAPDDTYRTRLVVTITPDGPDSLGVKVTASASDPLRAENAAGRLALYARTGRDLASYQRDFPE